MVQYIPGPEQLLAPAAAQITEGVLNFLNPHRQFQQAVQEALSKNPEIAQHFANLEASSPGLLRSIGIGRLASIPATPEKQFEIRNREAIVGGMEAELEATTVKNRFSTDQIKRAMTLIQQNPSIGMDAALKAVTGQTFAERSVSELAGKQAEAGQAAMQIPSIYAEAGTRAATGARSGELAKEQLLSQAITKAQEMMQVGPQVAWQKLLRNEYKNDELMAIFSTPLGDAIKQQMDFYMDQLRISLMSGRQDDAMERLMETQAFSLYNALKDPTLSIQDVLRYRLGQADDATKAKIEEGMTRLQVGDVNDVLSRNRRDLTALYTRYQMSLRDQGTRGKQGDEVREGLVNQINEILQTNAKLPGNELFTASYEDVVRNRLTQNVREAEHPLVPDRKRKEIIFRGPDGKIVDFSAVVSGGGQRPSDVQGGSSSSAAKSDSAVPTAQPGNKINLQPAQIERFKQHYNSLKTAGEKAAQKARWQQELDPASFKAIFP